MQVTPIKILPKTDRYSLQQRRTVKMAWDFTAALADINDIKFMIIAEGDLMGPYQVFCSMLWYGYYGSESTESTQTMEYFKDF